MNNMNRTTRGKDEFLKEIKENLIGIQHSLKELLKWVKFQNFSSLKQLLQSELRDDAKKLAYENTDGTKGLREVGKVSGVPAPTVQGWWNRWYNLGIVDESLARKGRMERICSLKDVGIEIPKEATGRHTSRKQQPADGEPQDANKNDALDSGVS